MHDNNSEISRNSEIERLHQWHDSLKKQTESSAVFNLFRAFMRMSPIVDKGCSWLLVGCGAAATLIMSYIDKISLIIDINHIKYSLVALTLAALFGFAEKYCATYVLLIHDLYENGLNLVTPIENEYNQKRGEVNQQLMNLGSYAKGHIDKDKIKTDLISGFPKILRNKLSAEYDKGVNDYLHTIRKTMGRLYMQGVYATLEILFFIIFLMIMITGV